MIYKELDTVVLASDLPDHDLMAGDLGAIVQLLPGAAEVEFVTGSGANKALVTLPLVSIRPIASNDIPSVRSAGETDAA